MDKDFIQDPATNEFLLQLLLFLADKGRIPNYEMTFGSCVHQLWGLGFRDLVHVPGTGIEIVKEPFGQGIALGRDATPIEMHELLTFFPIKNVSWEPRKDEFALRSLCPATVGEVEKGYVAHLGNAPMDPDTLQGQAVKQWADASSQIVWDSKQGLPLEIAFGLLIAKIDEQKVSRMFLEAQCWMLRLQATRKILPGEKITVNYAGNLPKVQEWGRTNVTEYNVLTEPDCLPDLEDAKHVYVLTIEAYKSLAKVPIVIEDVITISDSDSDSDSDSYTDDDRDPPAQGNSACSRCSYADQLEGMEVDELFLATLDVEMGTLCDNVSSQGDAAEHDAAEPVKTRLDDPFLCAFSYNSTLYEDAD